MLNNIDLVGSVELERGVELTWRREYLLQVKAGAGMAEPDLRVEKPEHVERVWAE